MKWHFHWTGGGLLRYFLAQVVYEWARGTPFNEICGLTDVMEGSIVRAMVRLDETCRYVLYFLPPSPHMP